MRDCVCVCIVYCGDNEVHVSHAGSDNKRCGPSTQPCATLRYALSQHPRASYINVNSTGGAYLSEAGSQYIVIDHNVTIVGIGPDPAVIQCTDKQHSRLFQFTAQSHRHRIVVNIEVKYMCDVSMANSEW